MAGQRLAGLGQDLRDSTRSLPAARTRQLLQARSHPSRRTLLKGVVGLGVVAASSWSVRERLLLPQLFSDYHTATGERRQLQLAVGTALQLDTRTTLDLQDRVQGPQLRLNSGRLLLTLGNAAPVRVVTAEARIHLAPLSQLMVSVGLPGHRGTRVQLLSGSASVSLGQGPGQVLGPRQQVDIEQRMSPVTPVAAAASAWTQGLLIAERMPLAEVIAELDRYRPGLLRCAAEVAGLRVSGSFSLDQPDASLDLLARTLPIRIQRVMGYWASVTAA
ncbi:FecR domain-containing protein [Pseudomonas sp. WS 5414]|uniref:FecR domain-containing protein n=1 Tax=Pseudomonas sp. WS 5414 TaxID=2717478 RepID=UPI0031FA2358